MAYLCVPIWTGDEGVVVLASEYLANICMPANCLLAASVALRRMADVFYRAVMETVMLARKWADELLE